jgi:excisionase family DNA binding protein
VALAAHALLKGAHEVESIKSRVERIGLRPSHQGQLARRLATTERHVELLIYSKRIPVIRLGHRTIRFSWPKVEAALEKLSTIAV